MIHRCPGKALLTALATTAVLIGLPSRLDGQVTVTWDHARCSADQGPDDPNCSPVLNVDAEDGDTIVLRVVNTCEDEFEFTVVSIEETEDGEASAAPTACHDTVLVRVRHDERFSGHIVHVVATGEEPPLGNARVTLAVDTENWGLDFGGGFAFTGIRDRVYALDPITDSSFEIVEQEDLRSSIGRSVVSLVHVSHSSWEDGGLAGLLPGALWRWGFPALSFGLSVHPSDEPDYFLGLSYMFGSVGALTAGLVAGSEARLPTGRTLGDTVSDVSTLGTLDERTVVSWFVGVTFRFLGSGADDLRKPFQGSGETPDTPPGAEPREETPGETPAAPALSIQDLDPELDLPVGQTINVSLRIADADGPVSGVTVTLVPEDATYLSGTTTGTTDEEGEVTLAVSRTEAAGMAGFDIQVTAEHEDGRKAEAVTVTVAEIT